MKFLFSRAVLSSETRRWLLVVIKENISVTFQGACTVCLLPGKSQVRSGGPHISVSELVPVIN
jgi:hypothetical protein